ncbi:nitroreductase/quinone reductase family protein [Nocardia cyriacigeorgica]|uniref:nitroreductase/quinone reductase family protein n=1 Tax=Nocardia cyriacigeorgica TaxID=135487 RepID=UPI0024590C1E|nr:nitroreductase/quinone reductase family protein [Nocardia cyriacigeorgica]
MSEESVGAEGADPGALPAPKERARNPFTHSPRGGRTLSALQAPFFRIKTPTNFAILTTTGRTSGKARHRCVRAVLDGDRAYLVMLGPIMTGLPKEQAIADWLRNVRADPNVRLKVPGRTRSGLAREITDPAEAARARQVYTSAVKPFDFAECRFHTAGRPTRAKIQRLHQHWFDNGVPVVIELV